MDLSSSLALPEFLLPVGDFVRENVRWAVPILFLLALGEGLAIVAFLVPSALLLICVTALIAAGAFDFATSYAAIVAGAVLGNALSYWIGRTFGDGISRFWPFAQRPELLARGRRFFERHGGKSVFISRFFGPLRAVVPITAGTMGMPNLHFQTYNLLSALVWAPLLMAPALMTLQAQKPAAPAASAPAPCAVAPPIAGERAPTGC